MYLSGGSPNLRGRDWTRAIATQIYSPRCPDIPPGVDSPWFMPNDNRSVVQVRLTAGEKRRVQAAAAKDDRTVSEWLRALLERGLRDAETASREPHPKTGAGRAVRR